MALACMTLITIPTANAMQITLVQTVPFLFVVLILLVLIVLYFLNAVGAAPLANALLEMLPILLDQHVLRGNSVLVLVLEVV